MRFKNSRWFPHRQCRVRFCLRWCCRCSYEERNKSVPWLSVEFGRNSVFDARSYFLPTTQPTTPFHQNQFGGSIGGPVLIPKLYNGKKQNILFGAYQGFRYYQFGSANLHVPTTAQLAGTKVAGRPRSITHFRLARSVQSRAVHSGSIPRKSKFPRT